MSVQVGNLLREIMAASPEFEEAIGDDNVEAIVAVLIRLASNRAYTTPSMISGSEMDKIYHIWRNADDRTCVPLLGYLFSEYWDRVPEDAISMIPVCYQAFVAFDKGKQILDISKIKGENWAPDYFPQMHFKTLIGITEDTYNLDVSLPNAIVDEAFFEDATCDSIPAIAAKTLNIKITDPVDERTTRQIAGPVADLIVFEANDLPYIETNAHNTPIKAIKLVQLGVTKGADGKGDINIPYWHLQDFDPNFTLYLPKGNHVHRNKRLIDAGIDDHIVTY